MRDRPDSVGVDLDEEAPAGIDAGKEGADTVIPVRSAKLPLPVTLRNRIDHESLELPGAPDTGSPH